MRHRSAFLVLILVAGSLAACGPTPDTGPTTGPTAVAPSVTGTTLKPLPPATAAPTSARTPTQAPIAATAPAATLAATAPPATLAATVPSAPAGTVTAVPAAATVPSTNVAGSAAIDVTDFKVALSYTPNTGAGTAPVALEAMVQFNATNNGPGDVHELSATRIVVHGAGGEGLLDTTLQGGVTDMRPQAGLPAGQTRNYSYTSVPGTSGATAAANDAVIGLLIVSVDGQEQQIALPATRVLPARIP
ncbi:MAG TPA: hypothetical protein VM536_03915 [Chloroflexia bacterium]|nr:hypothetical protein [Chloroflexia bacterium]